MQKGQVVHPTLDLLAHDLDSSLFLPKPAEETPQAMLWEGTILCNQGKAAFQPLHRLSNLSPSYS